MNEPTLYRYIGPCEYCAELSTPGRCDCYRGRNLVPGEIHGRFTVEVFLQSLEATANLIPGQYAIVYLGADDD